MNRPELPGEARTRLIQERPDLDGRSLEVWWVSRFVVQRRQRERSFLVEVLGRCESEADDLLSWDGQSCWELLERDSAKRSHETIEAAEAALNELARIFDSRISFYWKPAERPGGRIEVDKEIPAAFDVLRNAILRQPRADRKGGNFKSNRSEFIVDVSPTVMGAGFTMNACAGILAEAFENAGVESGNSEKRQRSIFQAIRNASL